MSWKTQPYYTLSEDGARRMNHVSVTDRSQRDCLGFGLRYVDVKNGLFQFLMRGEGTMIGDKGEKMLCFSSAGGEE